MWWIVELTTTVASVIWEHRRSDAVSNSIMTSGHRPALLWRSSTELQGNSMTRFKPVKNRQKEDKYFFNSVMEQRRRQPQTSVICKNFPGLNKKQLELCFRYPDVMAAAIQGLQLAVKECQHQFQKHRWNCSALERKNRNPHGSVFLEKGTFSNLFLLTDEIRTTVWVSSKIFSASDFENTNFLSLHCGN